MELFHPLVAINKYNIYRQIISIFVISISLPHLTSGGGGGGVETLIICAHTKATLECPEGRVLVLHRADITRKDLVTCPLMPNPESKETSAAPPSPQPTSPAELTTAREEDTNATTPAIQIDPNVTTTAEMIASVNTSVMEMDNNTTTTVEMITNGIRTSTSTGSIETDNTTNVDSYTEDSMITANVPSITKGVFLSTRSVSSESEGTTLGWTLGSVSTSPKRSELESTTPVAFARLTAEKEEVLRECPPQSVMATIGEYCFDRQTCEVYLNDSVIQTSACSDGLPYLVIDYICVQESQVHKMCSTWNKQDKVEENWGYVTTPGYPVHYNTSLVCTLTITAAKQNVTGIELAFLDIKMKTCFYPRSCCTDYIIVETDDWKSRQICRTPSDPILTLPNVNTVKLSFKSGIWRGSRGLLLEYKVLPFDGYPADNTGDTTLSITSEAVTVTSTLESISSDTFQEFPAKTTVYSLQVNTATDVLQAFTTQDTNLVLHDDDENTGMIVGLVVGLVAVVALISLTIIIFRRNASNDDKNMDNKTANLDQVPPPQVAAQEKHDQTHLATGAYAKNPNWKYHDKWILSAGSPKSKDTVRSSIEDLDHYKEEDPVETNGFVKTSDDQHGLEPLEFEFDVADHMKAMKDVGYLDMENDIYQVLTIDKVNQSEPVFILDHKKLKDKTSSGDVDISDTEEDIHVHQVTYVDVHRTGIYLDQKPPNHESKV